MQVTGRDKPTLTNGRKQMWRSPTFSLGLGLSHQPTASKKEGTRIDLPDCQALTFKQDEEGGRGQSTERLHKCSISRSSLEYGTQSRGRASKDTDFSKHLPTRE